MKSIIKYRKGFTLIELMIVIVILAILLGIAIPSYRSYVLKANRADAIATLARDQVALERCYTQNYAYNAACSGLAAFPHNSTEGYYSITISNLGASTYTLTATAIGNQTKDTTCRSFSVDQANQKTATNSGGTAQANCWAP